VQDTTLKHGNTEPAGGQVHRQAGHKIRFACLPIHECVVAWLGGVEPTVLEAHDGEGLRGLQDRRRAGRNSSVRYSSGHLVCDLSICSAPKPDQRCHKWSKLDAIHTASLHFTRCPGSELIYGIMTCGMLIRSYMQHSPLPLPPGMPLPGCPRALLCHSHSQSTHCWCTCQSSALH
jgi:hypothetical protein